MRGWNKIGRRLEAGWREWDRTGRELGFQVIGRDRTVGGGGMGLCEIWWGRIDGGS